MKRLLTLLASTLLTLTAGVALAQVKISDLPAAGALAGTEPVPIVQGGSTTQTTTAAIAALAGGGLTVASGTFTPTCTPSAPISACNGQLSHYIRVGNQVSFTIWLNATTTNAQGQLLLGPLPVPSGFTTSTNANGVCAGNGTAFGMTGRIEADDPTDSLRAFLNGNANTGSNPWSCSGIYTVI